MNRSRLTTAAALILSVLATTGISMSPAEAGGSTRQRTSTVDTGGAHPSSSYYRRGPQVKGFVARRGGYSYSTADTINTYGDARSRFGGTSVYRDTLLDRQTNSGPFDHGFFFDSGIAPRGGDSPYMN
jgi:hypothetical protein